MPNSNAITISPLHEYEVEVVSDLIFHAMQGYDQSGKVIGAVIRRIENIRTTYTSYGAMYFVARDTLNENKPVAGAGIGSLHGLPVSEGMGELRDLVVSKNYRGLGLGAKLIHACIEKSKEVGYEKLYLETTPQMKVAQKLFLRTGFRPIEDTSSESENGDIASYFILENLKT